MVVPTVTTVTCGLNWRLAWAISTPVMGITGSLAEVGSSITTAFGRDLPAASVTRTFTAAAWACGAPHHSAHTNTPRPARRKGNEPQEDFMWSGPISLARRCHANHPSIGDVWLHL